MTQIIQLDREDLRAELQSIFHAMQVEAEAQATEKAKECLFTPEEAAKMLSVSSVTMWRWQKNEYLVPVYVGGKKRYRNSDIVRIIEKGGGQE